MARPVNPFTRYAGLPVPSIMPIPHTVWVTTCKACGARVTSDEKVCTYCKTQAFPTMPQPKPDKR